MSAERGMENQYMEAIFAASTRRLVRCFLKHCHSELAAADEERLLWSESLIFRRISASPGMTSHSVLSISVAPAPVLPGLGQRSSKAPLLSAIPRAPRAHSRRGLLPAPSRNGRRHSWD